MKKFTLIISSILTALFSLASAIIGFSMLNYISIPTILKNIIYLVFFMQTASTGWLINIIFREDSHKELLK